MQLNRRLLLLTLTICAVMICTGFKTINSRIAEDIAKAELEVSVGDVVMKSPIVFLSERIDNFEGLDNGKKEIGAYLAFKKQEEAQAWEDELARIETQRLEHEEIKRLYEEELEEKRLAEVARVEKIDKAKVEKNSEKSSKSRLLGVFEVTSYTDDVQSQGKWVGKTATGMKPQVGVIAVDPKVIPLHSKVIVEGYNGEQVAICGDTGGNIKGKRIDVFHNTKKQSRAWGRQKVKVWIVE